MNLTRRGLLKASGTAAGVVLLGPLRESASTLVPGATPVPTGAWNHDPASPIGPRHWGDIGFRTCGQGMAQSPVDIRTDKVTRYRGAPLLLW